MCVTSSTSTWRETAFFNIFGGKADEFQTFESAVDEKVYVALFCHCIFCEGTEENCISFTPYFSKMGVNAAFIVSMSVYWKSSLI